MRESPILHSPCIVSYVCVFACSFRVFPLYHDGWDDGEARDGAAVDEFCDGHVQSGFEVEGCVVQ